MKRIFRDKDSSNRFEMPLENEEPRPSTSSSCPESSPTPELARLRNRKVDLNALAASQTRPKICKLQNCGIRLKDNESLEWHYEGHFNQEIEKLKKIKVRKPRSNLSDQEDKKSRRLVRNLALEKIRFHRQKRQALARSSNQRVQNSETERPLECPVCEKTETNEDEFSAHIEACLRVAPPPPDETNDYESDVDLEGIDVDSMEGFESYTWAGQTRIRATSLVEGGLRGAGFMTITHGDEDGELDIENIEEEPGGNAQYNEEDVIQLNRGNDDDVTHTNRGNDDVTHTNRGNDDVTHPNPSNDDITHPNSNNDDRGQGEPSNKHENSTHHHALKSPFEEFGFESTLLPTSFEDLKKFTECLIKENSELKKQTVCKICMDPQYEKPLVSLVCWHVHCEECWMRSLGAKKLCPQCKVIIQPKDLRRIYL